MVSVTRRPWSEEESGRLREAAQVEAPAVGRRRGVTVGIAAALAGFMFAAGFHFAFAAFVGVLMWRMAALADRRRQEAVHMLVEASSAVFRRDLEGGEAEVLRVVASAVVARTDRHDEPPAFVFDVGGGELFAVCDGGLAQAVAGGLFPSGDFELIVGPESGALMGLTVHAPALTPDRVADFELLESPQFFEGSLASVGDLD